MSAEKDAFGRPLDYVQATEPATRGELAKLARLRKEATDRAIAKLMRVLAALVVVSLLGGVVGFIAKDTATSNNSARIIEINEGRSRSSKVLCGLNTAQLQTNKRTIEGSGEHFTRRQEHGLESLGLGSRADREAQARAAGARYIKGVRESVEDYVGKGTAEGRAAGAVILPDGRIDCAHLQNISRIPSAQR